ncbi:MAG: adenylyltransferase/cytidyltransferase family protein [Candidatus Aenigmarchaeota archaeon]|nr:adenylyltransferase/cytidyltransferase family protein [Candidatus Aenigmarchaeota archaeon]
MIALFVCRLQPMHNGHLHAIKKILGKYGSVLVAIGSSNVSRQRANPFSFEERKEMLTSVLGKENLLGLCRIVGIPDIGNDGLWAKEFEKYGFEVVVTGNDWTKRCLSPGHKTEDPDFLEPEKYNATRIRNIIRLRGEWKFLVPGEVYAFVKKKLDSGEVKIDGELEKTTRYD